MQHFLLVRVDTLEVLHLRHLDEPHERSQKVFVGLSGMDLFDHVNPLQNFRTLASSGDPMIYNCSDPGLCGRNFCFRYPNKSWFHL